MCLKGRQMAPGAAACVAALACGLTARDQASQPNKSAMKNIAVVAGKPRATGLTDAKTTPVRPQPSRQATMRLRCASLPPSMAPQDWCDTLSAL